MYTTPITIAAVFGFAVLLAMPLGWLLKFQLRPGRFTHLDGMRAIAALMVVCSHYIAHAGLITGEAVSAPLRDSLGAVGVQIFFCITGFLFTRKAMGGRVDINALITSRVRRIVPLYIVAMTVGVAVAVYMIKLTPNPPAIAYRDILRTYTYGFLGGPIPSISGMSVGGQVGQMWTLSWEWLFYLLVPFIAVLLARPTLGIAALLFAAACATCQFYAGGLPPWSFFLPGMLCALVSDRVKVGAKVQMALTVVGLAAFAASLHMDAPAYGVGQMGLCLIGFPALLFGHRAPLSIKPLRLVGEASYSIYMLHLIVASAFWVYIQGNGNWMVYKTPADKLPIAVACLVGMIVLSFVTYAFIERPFMAQAKPQADTPAPLSAVGLVAPAVTD
jgi:peptidoglycan/LPS O-acetylase OafA/YrhL